MSLQYTHVFIHTYAQFMLQPGWGHHMGLSLTAAQQHACIATTLRWRRFTHSTKLHCVIADAQYLGTTSKSTLLYRNTHPPSMGVVTEKHQTWNTTPPSHQQTHFFKLDRAINVDFTREDQLFRPALVVDHIAFSQDTLPSPVYIWSPAHKLNLHPNYNIALHGKSGLQDLTQSASTS